MSGLLLLFPKNPWDCVTDDIACNWCCAITACRLLFTFCRDNSSIVSALTRASEPSPLGGGLFDKPAAFGALPSAFWDLVHSGLLCTLLGFDNIWSVLVVTSLRVADEVVTLKSFGWDGEVEEISSSLPTPPEADRCLLNVYEDGRRSWRVTGSFSDHPNDVACSTNWINYSHREQTCTFHFCFRYQSVESSI